MSHEHPGHASPAIFPVLDRASCSQDGHGRGRVDFVVTVDLKYGISLDSLPHETLAQAIEELKEYQTRYGLPKSDSGWIIGLELSSISTEFTRSSCRGEHHDYRRAPGRSRGGKVV